MIRVSEKGVRPGAIGDREIGPASEKLEFVVGEIIPMRNHDTRQGFKPAQKIERPRPGRVE